MRRVLALLILCLLPGWLMSVQAQAQTGIRTLDPIGEGAAPAGTVPVPTAAVEDFIHELAAAWNERRLEPLLAPEYPDRDRVIAGFPERVAPGTRLRILSVGPVQTVEQERRGNTLVSTVVAGVRAQLEIPQADGGIRRKPTTQELLIRVVRQVPE